MADLIGLVFLGFMFGLLVITGLLSIGILLWCFCGFMFEERKKK